MDILTNYKLLMILSNYDYKSNIIEKNYKNKVTYDIDILIENWIFDLDDRWNFSDVHAWYVVLLWIDSVDTFYRIVK